MRHVRTMRGENSQTPIMKITTIEKRMPFEIALSCAFRSGLDPSLELVIREELESLVAESAKKFTGFKNLEAIREALNTTLGILSLAVVHSTKGDVDLDSWTKQLKEKGLKNLAREAVEMIRPLAECSSNASFGKAFISGSEGSVRDFLIRYATLSDQSNGKWAGYREYVISVTSRVEARRMEKLVSFLIERFTKKSSEGWLLHMADMTETSWEGSIVDEILNTFIFRYCVGLPTSGNVTLKLRQFAQVRNLYQADKETWKEKANAKYQKLVDETPSELRAGYLIRGNWFTKHLAKGPPRLPKDAKDRISLAGITGIYLYDFFR